MNQGIPSDVTLSLNLGGVAGALFFFANLYVLLHLIKKLVAPKTEWKWLGSMKSKWHYVHYIGNIAALIVVVVHAVRMWQYASVFNWLLIAVMSWMVLAGFIIKFTKASPQFKKTLRMFHAKWYMYIVVLTLLIIAHVVSLLSFPYPVG